MKAIKIMNFYERMFQRIAKFMFKISKAITPSYIDIMFSLRPINETIQSLRSVNTSNFQISQKEIYKQKFYLLGTNYLEQFARLVKKIETVNSFHNNCINWMKSMS